MRTLEPQKVVENISSDFEISQKQNEPANLEFNKAEDMVIPVVVLGTIGFLVLFFLRLDLAMAVGVAASIGVFYAVIRGYKINSHTKTMLGYSGITFLDAALALSLISMIVVSAGFSLWIVAGVSLIFAVMGYMVKATLEV